MTESYKVEGIMCPNCVAKVKKALSTLEGIENVSVSDDFQTVTLTKQETVTSEMIKAAIERIEEKDFVVLGKD